ncbi:MAG: hypothetical protein ABL903_17420 [Methylococcales bacterium]
MKKRSLLALMLMPAVVSATEIENFPPENQASVLTEELQDRLRLKSGIRPKTVSLTADESKATALFGTWQVSYTYNGKQGNDKIVLDTITSGGSDKVYAGGKVYFDNTAAEGDIACGYDPATMGTLEADYMCVAVPAEGNYRIYAFKFSGNRITGGYYESGSNLINATFDLFLKRNPLSGFREVPMPATVTPSEQDSFDFSKGELTLPSVKVGNDFYSAILTTHDGENFKLKSVVKK